MTVKPTLANMRSLIASRFHILRLDSGLSIVDAAKQIGIPERGMRAIEAGDTLPNVLTAGLICAFYDAPVDFILTGTGLTRELTLPKDVSIILEALTTPVDLAVPLNREETQVGLLRIKMLPVAQYDIKRQILRGTVPKKVPFRRPVKPTLTVDDLKGAGLVKIKTKPVKKSMKPVKKKPVDVGNFDDVIATKH